MDILYSPLSVPFHGSCLGHIGFSLATVQVSLSVRSSLSFRKLRNLVSSECYASPSVIEAVTLSFSDLADKSLNLSSTIKEGFGPKGLGVICISDVPGYPTLRRNLLMLAPRLGNLPKEVQEELEDPISRYNFGWSHGKEKLENDKFDMQKGSFYANPILDVPTTDDSLKQRYPSYCRPNIWPSTSLPELEAVFKSLGKLMLDVGLLLAYHCDQYVLGKGAILHKNKSLEELLQHSRCHKGRLLYYFPKEPSSGVREADMMSSWCGWHTDHGSLTGLTCALFTKDSAVINCPDENAGLYIQTKSNQIVKVFIEEDNIAYQVGETTEILSMGALSATPHCVKSPQGNEAFGVDRSTFAFFMQPDWNEEIHFHKGLHHKEILPRRPLTFGEYSELLVSQYYAQ